MTQSELFQDSVDRILPGLDRQPQSEQGSADPLEAFLDLLRLL